MVQEQNKNYLKVASNLRGLILGSTDGIISSLGVVAGVSGIAVSNIIVLTAGLATALAEAVSMFFSAYISVKSEVEVYKSAVETEKQEMRDIPKTERREIKDIYYAKGFRGKLLSAIVKHITSNKKLWLKTMLVEELGFTARKFESPVRNASYVFAGDIIGGLIPVLPFFLPVAEPFKLSLMLSTIALFVMGILKARVTKKNLLRSGLETIAVGLIAATLAYGVGSFLGQFK